MEADTPSGSTGAPYLLCRMARDAAAAASVMSASARRIASLPPRKATCLQEFRRQDLCVIDVLLLLSQVSRYHNHIPGTWYEETRTIHLTPGTSYTQVYTLNRCCGPMYTRVLRGNTCPWGREHKNHTIRTALPSNETLILTTTIPGTWYIFYFIFPYPY